MNATSYKPFTPYVTDKGGVVILNGPFPMKESRRIATLCEAAPDMLAALKAQADANFFADYISSNTPDGQAIKKEWMDKADLLFSKARKLRYAAIAKAEAKS